MVGAYHPHTYNLSRSMAVPYGSCDRSHAMIFSYVCAHIHIRNAPRPTQTHHIYITQVLGRVCDESGKPVPKVSESAYR